MKRSPIDVHHFAFSTPDAQFIELHQLLKVVGIVDSGGAGKALVATGNVKVDAVLELRKTAKIRAGQQVSLPGVTIHIHPYVREFSKATR
jgi:ribosome-associated protein